MAVTGTENAMNQGEVKAEVDKIGITLVMEGGKPKP